MESIGIEINEPYIKIGLRRLSIPSNYDSMIGKLITFAESREVCIQKMKRALEEYVIIGIDTNIQLHQKIIASNEFITGNYDINYMSRFD